MGRNLSCQAPTRKSDFKWGKSTLVRSSPNLPFDVTKPFVIRDEGDHPQILIRCLWCMSSNTGCSPRDVCPMDEGGNGCAPLLGNDATRSKLLDMCDGGADCGPANLEFCRLQSIDQRLYKNSLWCYIFVARSRKTGKSSNWSVRIFICLYLIRKRRMRCPAV